MKSLFRSLRGEHVQDGHATRFLAYAVGEILLIVMGILLALQINNWNEGRREQDEFDEYIAQLTEDVIAAIEWVEGRRAGMMRAQGAVGVATTVLDGLRERPRSSADLAQFDEAVGNLGKFGVSDIPYGTLRELLDGNFDAIARAERLAATAYEVVTDVEFRERVIGIEAQRLEHSEAIWVRYRGLSRDLDWPTDMVLEPRYDMDRLRASEDFFYATYNSLHVFYAIQHNYGVIAEELERFLAVLQSYE